MFPCCPLARYASRIGVLSLTTLFVALWFLVGNPKATPADDAKPGPEFALHAGDHICIIGNTLADRMQHFGWLETLLQARFSRLELVLRNLGFSGDELTHRERSDGFGSPDEWLTFHKADVVFAFFGYNESFGGPAGLDQFKKDLADFIKHTLSQKYNGKQAPRLVLFSPIAQENLHDRNLPDGAENNKRIALYTGAMADVARANNIPFVDLFQISRDLYSRAAQPLTINGIHMNEHGDWLLARGIDRALFPRDSELTQDRQAFERLRHAVLDKDVHWFHRYRTVDGYNVYGGRSYEKYADNQTNRVVMQREMQIFDAMTANRDKRIWAVAQGGDAPVNDSNAPPLIPTRTNRPGPGPNGTYLFLDGNEAIQKMTLAKGMKINLFASEKEFPDLAKPVQMAFDAKGRLWVAVWPGYPHWRPTEQINDKLLVFEDTNGDGKADKMTVFADHLNCPTGFTFYNGGVLVAQAPGLVFLKDTNGDGKADLRVRVLEGLDSADTHHTANSFALDPGGAVYFQEGVFHHTQVETPYGPPQRCTNAGVYRYEPRSQKFDVYITYPFANPHGHLFDRWGQDIVYDGTGANPYHAALISGHLEYPNKHPHAPQVYQQRTRPCPGVEVLSSRHFPEANQDHLLVGNVIGFQGILQYKVADDGASFHGTEVEPIVSSTDPNFRPSDIKIGPDGAIYFLDWQNPLIGHLQHHLRDPNRDRTHGRIYRITAEGRPLLTPAKIAGEPIEKLLDLLKEPENNVRQRAKIELGGRDTDEVIAALGKWIAGLDKSDSAYEHHLLEGLWVYQYHNVVDAPLLRRMLTSPDFHARAAAVRVLCYWRDRIPDALQLLKQLAADANPRVRLEAVRAASFIPLAEAIEVALIAGGQPSDRYLDYVQRETRRALDPYVKRAIAEGHEIALSTAAAARNFLRTVSTDDLLKLKRNPDVYHELLARNGIPEDSRREALSGLANLQGKTEPVLLLNAIREQDASANRPQNDSDNGSLYDLVRLLTSRNATELAPVRSDIEKLATTGRRPATRQLAFVALAATDGNVDAGWQVACRSVRSLDDFVRAVPLLRDPMQRAQLYPRVLSLLHQLPQSLGSKPDDGVRRSAMIAVTSVRGQEASAFKELSRFVREGVDRSTAIHAIQRIPAADWPAEEARPLLDSLIGFLKTLPAKDRTGSDGMAALQLGDSLAALLPLDDARRIRHELGELGVRVIRLATVPEQMLYDKDRLVVQAGKPVELIFENNDLMPHNFVITQPGALEEIGQLAETTATQPGAVDRGYVPVSNKVLQAILQLQPRSSQKLDFMAPAQPGVYPYVCTYPGHWRRMYGSLYVVPDLDEYLANAEGYLTKHPLPVADDLLKFNRPRKEWKFEDLAAAASQMDHGRSFSNGKLMFQVASCISCHRFDGLGVEIGPDLTKLDPKQQAPIEILHDIVEPSFRINAKYQSYLFETQSGKLITGLVLQETADTVKVIENPLAKTEPVVLKRSDIVERKRVPTSLMPKGLLDKLTREEILDLVAYIAARGDPHHKVFQGECGHALHH
jgi:putative heme-binding domain-containing protein